MNDNSIAKTNFMSRMRAATAAGHLCRMGRITKERNAEIMRYLNSMGGANEHLPIEIPDDIRTEYQSPKKLK